MLFKDDSAEDPAHTKRVEGTALRADLIVAKLHIRKLLDGTSESPALVEQVGGILDRYRRDATDEVNVSMLKLAPAKLALVDTYLKQLRRDCEELNTQFEAGKPVDLLKIELMAKAQKMHIEAGALRIAFTSLHESIARGAYTDQTVFDQFYSGVEAAANSIEGLAGRNTAEPSGPDERFRGKPR